MDDDMVYFDYNATTPVAAEVADAMDPYFREFFANPSSGHPPGRRAKEGLESAREKVAALLGADAGEIIITGSGTESNNIAVRGSIGVVEREEPAIAISRVEHPAVEEPCRHLETQGAEILRIGVDRDGRLEVGELEDALHPGVQLISVMHANNETGAMQPIRRVAELADAYDALLHTDASQTVGKVEVDVERLGVDLLTVTGHKFYAPKGVGALYARDGVELEPVLRGASHEGGVRPGTENVPGAVALGRACLYAERRLPERREEMRRLRERLWGHLRDGKAPVVRHGEPSETLPNTLNVRFEGLRGDRVLDETDAVAASTGSACHEGGEPEPSSVLTAMGVDPEAALGSVRLSLGEMTTEEEIDRAGPALVETARQLREGETPAAQEESGNF